MKTYWNPATEAPPEPGVGRQSLQSELQVLDWHTCIVQCQNYDTVQQVYQWLASGKHPFRSVVLDSITELQKRVIDQTTGIAQPTQADWGHVLRTMEDDVVRKIRDLLFHPTRPLECVMFLALTHNKDGKYRAYVKGQLELTLPGYTDVVGYLYADTNPSGVIVRKLLIQPLGDYDAKDRTDYLTQQYGYVIDEPNLEGMIAVIDAATTAPATPQPAEPSAY